MMQSGDVVGACGVREEIGSWASTLQLEAPYDVAVACRRAVRNKVFWRAGSRKFGANGSAWITRRGVCC